jgi:hypothetical protein
VRDRDRAAAELARRYLRVHAPAAPEDLAAWSGLPVRDARAGWSAIAGDLTEVAHVDGPLWRPRRGGPRPARVAVALLPAFDEYLLGWRDRRLIVSDADARRLFRGGGMLPATVLADGQLAGTWRRERGGGVTTTLFAPVDDDALAAETEDLARFTAS